MILFPAIDLKDGKCVRLVQGDFNKFNAFKLTLIGSLPCSSGSKSDGFDS